MMTNWRVPCVEKRNKWVRRLLTLAAGWGIIFADSLPVDAADGQDLFVKHCALCHGKDGKAQNPAARKLGVKDLSLSKATDGEIEKQVAEGTKDKHGNQKMPPFGDKLTLEEIKSLIPVVKGFRK
jgi:cytochrome c6